MINIQTLNSNTIEVFVDLNGRNTAAIDVRSYADGIKIHIHLSTSLETPAYNPEGV